MSPAIVSMERYRTMKRVFLVFLGLLSASCSPAQALAPMGTPTTDARATLIASPTTFEITFDGETCVVDGPEEVTMGEHMLVLHDRSDLSAYHVVVRHYPDHSFEDEMKWVEENCGPPGSYCDGDSGLIAGYQPSKSTIDAEGNSYKLIDFAFEAEHSLWVGTPQGYWWPCSAFFVVAGP